MAVRGGGGFIVASEVESVSKGAGYRRTEELRARHRWISLVAYLVSLGLHILIFVIFRGDGVPSHPFAAAGPRAGDDQAAPAGGGTQVVNLRVATVQPPEATAAPVPVPEVVVEVMPEPEPEPEPAQVEPPKVEAVAEPGSGGTQVGVGEVLGREGGTGRGDGGTEGEGRFRAEPPRPRGVIIPPGDRPKKVRGKDVSVWVFVTETGVVVPDSTRLMPSTGDAKFDERLRRQAADWVFQPAMRDGKAVAEWFRFEISF